MLQAVNTSVDPALPHASVPGEDCWCGGPTESLQLLRVSREHWIWRNKGSRQGSKAATLPGFSLHFYPLAYEFSSQTGSAIQMVPPRLLDKASETHDTYTCKRKLCTLRSCCQIQNTVKEQRNALNSVMRAFGRRVMLLAVRLSPEMEIHNSVCGSVSSIKTLSLFLLSKYI